MAKYRFKVIVEVDEDGKYIASCPALPACYAQGDTLEEALENIKDVIEMCLEELREEGKEPEVEKSEIVAVKEVEVAV